jgi:hypothetical protein
VIDHRRRLDDPRIGAAVGPAALLGPEYRRLLLRPADEQDAFPAPGGQESLQVLVRDIVLALPLYQVHDRDVLRGGEGMDGLLEPG